MKKIRKEYVQLASASKKLELALHKFFKECEKNPNSHFDSFDTLETILDEIIDWAANLANHPEPLNRILAIETLTRFHLSQNKLEKLILKKIKDKDSLVRSYAALALGESLNADYGDHLLKMLKIAGEKEKVFIHYALTILGYKKYFQEFLKGLKSTDYLIRCSTANLCVDLCKPQFRKTILSKLQKAKSLEKSAAAKSSINGAIFSLTKKCFSKEKSLSLPKKTSP